MQIVLTYPMAGILFAFACQVLSSAASLLPFHNHSQLPLTKRDSSKVSQMWQLLPWSDVRSIGWGRVENLYSSPVGHC